MSWSSWFNSGNGEAASKEVSAEKSESGYPETHYISTAGGGKNHSGGGDRNNHAHVIVEHRPGGRTVAHAIPHRKNR